MTEINPLDAEALERLALELARLAAEEERARLALSIAPYIGGDKEAE